MAGCQYGAKQCADVLQAIKASSCYVDDISKANVVYVYDYCYYIWWLAHIHSAVGKKVEGETPGDHLIKVRLCLVFVAYNFERGKGFV